MSGGIDILGGPEKAGMLTMSWDSWLFQLLSAFLWDCLILECAGQLEAVCEVGPLGHSHFQAVWDADFERTWEDAGRAEDKVKKFRRDFVFLRSW